MNPVGQSANQGRTRRPALFLREPGDEGPAQPSRFRLGPAAIDWQCRRTLPAYYLDAAGAGTVGAAGRIVRTNAIKSAKS
jgi:hypothetical protein